MRVFALFALVLVACDDDTHSGRCRPGDPCERSSGHILCVPPPLDCAPDEHPVAYHVCGLTHRDARGHAVSDGELSHWLLPAGTPPASGCALSGEWCDTAPASGEGSGPAIRARRDVASLTIGWDSRKTDPHLAGWWTRRDDVSQGFTCCPERPEWLVSISSAPIIDGFVDFDALDSVRWTCPGPAPPPDFERPLPPPLVLP